MMRLPEGAGMDDHGAGQQSGGRVSKRCLVLALAIVLGVAPVIVSFFLTLKTALAWDQNLLQNGGFEEGTSGWMASFGADFITVTDPVSSGNWAGALNGSGTTGEIYVHQQVNVLPGATYTVTAWIYKDEPSFSYVRLGMYWLDSQWDDPASADLTDDAGFYRPITLGPAVAPPDASRAQIRLVAWIRESPAEEPICFDELTVNSNMVPVAFIPVCLKNYPR
jgi:hypothetical protein